MRRIDVDDDSVTADRGDQTLVSWRQVFDNPGNRERIASIVLDANEQNLDRLAAEACSVP